MTSPIRILGLCGSLRPASYTRQALQLVLEQAGQHGASCTLLEPAELNLPLCHGGKPTAAVHELRQQVIDVDALVLGSPEYCGTVSAVLKNAVEWIGYEQLNQKVTGLLAVAAGSSADGSLNALRQLALTQGMWVLPAAAPVPLAERVFERADDHFSQMVRQHLIALGRALPEAVRRLRGRPDTETRTGT